MIISQPSEYPNCAPSDCRWL